MTMYVRILNFTTHTNFMLWIFSVPVKSWYGYNAAQWLYFGYAYAVRRFKIAVIIRQKKTYRNNRRNQSCSWDMAHERTRMSRVSYILFQLRSPRYFTYFCLIDENCKRCSRSMPKRWSGSTRYSKDATLRQNGMLDRLDNALIFLTFFPFVLICVCLPLLVGVLFCRSTVDELAQGVRNRRTKFTKAIRTMATTCQIQAEFGSHRRRNKETVHISEEKCQRRTRIIPLQRARRAKTYSQWRSMGVQSGTCIFDWVSRFASIKTIIQSWTFMQHEFIFV